jgi:hypothetical protein
MQISSPQVSAVPAHAAQLASAAPVQMSSQDVSQQNESAEQIALWHSASSHPGGPCATQQLLFGAQGPQS